MRKFFGLIVVMLLLGFSVSAQASGTLADVGADSILGTYFNGSPAVGNLTLKLFCTNVSPADTNTAGSYTACTGGGYADKTLTNGSWTLTTGNDPSDVVYAQQVFTFTGALTTNGTIYGYFVVNASGTLLWAEAITNFVPANNGDHYDVTPKFKLSKGTAN